MSTKGQVTFNPGEKLREWLDAQAERWGGIGRAATIKIILTSWSKTHPEGQARTPDQEGGP